MTVNPLLVKFHLLFCIILSANQNWKLLSASHVDLTTQQPSTFRIPKVSQRTDNSVQTATNIEGKYEDLYASKINFKKCLC